MLRCIARASQVDWFWRGIVASSVCVDKIGNKVGLTRISGIAPVSTTALRENPTYQELVPIDWVPINVDQANRFEFRGGPQIV